MLYATTRSQNDVYTAHKAIHLDCAADGGLFLPYQFPHWNREAVRALAHQSFGQTVAQVLGSFFSCELTGWDVEFAIGRSPVKLASIHHRVTIAELFHNEKWELAHLVQTLSDRIRKEGAGERPTDWVRMAVSIAVIFGVFGECLQKDDSLLDNPVDLAVTTGSFTLAMAAWYARSMGLPIHNIVCGCNANGAVWDLVHRGEMPTGGAAVATVAPLADHVVPRDLERLVFATLGRPETLRYLQCCATGSVYSPLQEQFETLRRGVFASVISDSRVKTLIPGVYRSSSYIFGPYGALAYGSLMDYRAKTGESRRAILLSERSPICDGNFVAHCLGISLADLHQKLTLG